MKKIIAGILSFFLSFMMPLYAQDASLLPNAVQQFFDNNGNPLTSGKVYFYEVGTTTFKNTYTSSTGLVINQNPITLNAAGRAPTGGIYGLGLYQQVVKDRNGNLIWSAITAPGGGGSTPTDVGDGNLVGTVLPWSGLIVPNQYVFGYGQAINRASFPEFFTAITQQVNVICSASSNILTGISDTTQIRVGSPIELSLCVIAGSTVTAKTASTVTLSNPSSVSTNSVATFFPYGNGNGTTTFNVPDLRGYAVAGRDNMGGTAASRLTSTYFAAAGLGAIGGSQSHTQTISEMAIHNHSVNDPGHIHAIAPMQSQSITVQSGAGNTFNRYDVSGTKNTNTATTGITLNSAGSSVPFTIVQPTITINYIVKVTPDTSTSIATGVYSISGMTGVITCGSGVLCTGNTISVVDTDIVSAADVSFLQTGTGAAGISLDNILRSKIYTPEMFVADGIACGIADAGPAIQRAITAAGSVGGSVNLAPCDYTVVTPIVDSFGVRLIGSNRVGTRISFAPLSNNQIAYRVRNAGNIVTGGSIENVTFFSSDTVLTKTAIELEDVSNYNLNNVRVAGSTAGIAAFWGGAGNSIGLRIRGREFIRTNSVQIAANKPLVFSKNPNSTIDSDVSNYSNINVIATPTNAGITIDDALSLTRNNFSDISIAGGTHGVSWINTTGTIPSDGNTFTNFGIEQGDDPASYNYVLQGNSLGLIRNLILTGFHTLDNSRHGISLRSTVNLSMSGIFYQGLVAKQCLDTNNTVINLSWTATLFQECSTAAFGGMELISAAARETDTILPRWANYNTALQSNGFNVGMALTIPGSSSGLATFIPQSVQGTPVISVPTSTGTLAVTATLPVVLNATTGAISCPTCTMAAQATNTILGNATSGSAVPTALAIGSCSTAASALIWTTNTGFGCNTSITANAVAVGGITGLGTGVATALAATPNAASGVATIQTKTPNIVDGSGAGLAFTVVQEGFQIGNTVYQYVSVAYPVTASGSNAQLNGLNVTVPNRASASSCHMTRQNAGFAIQVFPTINTANLNLYTIGGSPLTNTQLSNITFNFTCIYPAT